MIVAILGAGGHGRDIAAIAQAVRKRVRFYDDDPGDPWSRRTIRRHFDRSKPYVVGVNDPATRRRLAVGSNAVTLVHPTATVAQDVKLSPGVVVGAGTTIGPETVLGEHVHIGPGCTLTRTSVGAYTTISPGVDIAGDVTIGDECLIGVGATISNLCAVGAGATIGAGAVLPPRTTVPSGETWAGVPARQLHPEGVPA